MLFRKKIYLREDLPFLHKTGLSRLYRYKVCVVCKTKKKRNEIKQLVDTNSFFNSSAHIVSDEKRCGYVSFFYFDKFREAVKLRERLYKDKDCYVFLQDDKLLLRYYRRNK